MAYPVTRQGWARYYARLFARTGSQQAATLATWFWLLMLAEGEATPEAVSQG